MLKSEMAGKRSIEWEDRFNSFNSDKILLHSAKLQEIADWVKGKNKELPPPIEVSFDPIHSCNLMCEHCNANSYLSKGIHRMTDKHILELVHFLASWGVKSACFGGGGEPTLHTKLGEALELAHSMGMESSLATNGTIMGDKLIATLVKCCSYVGVSVDSATRETYKIGRKKDLFNDAIKNIEKLVKASSKCSIAYKFLVFGYNQHEIFKACKLAKNLGVRDFHVRPADFRHQGMGELKKKQSEYNINLINEEFQKCHEIEDEKFRVYTVLHKFNEDLTPKRKFKQCYASPISIQVCADSNIYYCPDTRFVEYFKLGRHDPISEIKKAWGSDFHRELVSKTACSSCTSRCTFAVYNEVCERLFINEDDPMYRNFI